MIPMQRSLMIAGAIGLVAAAVFGSALARALTTDAVEPVAAPAAPANAPPEETTVAVPDAPGQTVPGKQQPPPHEQPAGGSAARELDLEALMVAVDHDPFRPERQRPNQPYRLPGEEIPEEEPPPPAPPPPPFRVLATAVMPAGGIALVQVQESVNRVLSVGETIMGYKLAQVRPGSATLEGNAGAVTLRVEDPQPTPRTRNQRGRGREQPAGRGRANSARERQLEGRAEQMREAIERLRANGGNPRQIEQLMELMGRELEQVRRNMEVEVQRGRGGANQIIIRPRADTMLSSR